MEATRSRGNPLGKVVMLIGLAVGSGVATYAVANAATAAVSAGTVPSSMATPVTFVTTHNCPKMPNM